MQLSSRQFLIFLILSAPFFLTGCTSSGGGYTSVSYGVYGGYGGYGGYGYGYGYGGCCYNDPDRPDRPDRPNRPDKPDRPDRPTKPSRPSIQPINRSSSRMGRPSSMGMSRGGGGGRRR